jgi:hypothetical protein
MNKSTMLRSEEARRQAQAMLLEAKQLQEQAIEERAMFFASETRKVADLRAQRLARTAPAKDAATTASRAVSRARS